MNALIETEIQDEPRIYKIPAANMDRLIDRIETMNKRAKRLKCEPIVIETVSTDRILLQDGTYAITYQITIEGEAPRINGWIFRGSVELMDEGTITHAVPGAEEDLLPYRDSASKCDHCKTDRKRNTTYILRNEENGNIQQVGKTCLSNFLNHADPSSYAYDAEFLATASEICEGEEDEDREYSKSAPKILDLETYLAIVHACIRSYGWVSKKKAQEEYIESTASQAIGAMIARKMYPGAAGNLKIEEQDWTRTKDALAWIREIQDPNEYIWNLSVICKSIALKPKHRGIAASLFVAFDRAMAQAREIATAKLSSHHQGTVGKRQVFTSLTVDRVFYSEGNYGVTSIYSLSDEAGNQFTWFSSTGGLEVEKTYTMTATIKAHDEYKGVQKTILTRCSKISEQ